MLNDTKCPGCGKHCLLTMPKCKFGKTYAEKHNYSNAVTASAVLPKKKKKWERWVTHGDLIWRFLTISCQLKRGLRKGKITEEKLLSKFSEEEKRQFNDLLRRFYV